MSNFMDFLKNYGSANTNRLVNETDYVEKPQYEKKEKKEKVKNYRHGNSAIVTKASDGYKGYFGHVIDFFPATYELKTDGEAYVETSTIMNQDITGKVYTQFGESKVLEKITATQQGTDYIDFIVFTDRETSKQKVGLYVNDTSKIISYLESEGNDSNQAYAIRENKNNNFVRELKQDNLVEMMKKLQTNDVRNDTDIQELILGINSIDLNKNTDSLIELLKTSVETYDNSNYGTEYGANVFPILPKLEDILFERKISIVFSKDLIGPHHYMIMTGKNKGWNKVYKPDRDYYKISYTLVVKYKPSEIKVDKQNKKYAFIKKGNHAGKKFLIVKYNKAKMMLRLTSNNRELVYEPSDVFYFDIKLTNGNVAEVVDTLFGNKLKIREKVEASNEMVIRIISENEIAEKLSGFTLSDTENEREVVSSRETNPFDDFYIPGEFAGEFVDEPIYDEEYDEDKSQSGDYNEPEETNEIEREELIEGENSEGQAKVSFKDTERTSKVMDELTSKQQEILNMIKKASNSFGYYIEEYEILSKVENVIGCLKTILKKNSISDYNIRFIIILVIMYEAIKNSIDHDFDKIINKLFKGENSKGFFSAKDLSAENRNNFIFFESVLGDPSEAISKINALTKNKKQTFGENKDILKELILYSDSIVQKCIGSRFNIRRKYELDLSQLIPLGINQETGRRIKDESEEHDLLRLNNIKNYYTSKNMLDNIMIPSNEVPINWDHDSKKVLEKFSKGLTQKAKNQPEASKTILTIKDNLYRAPFAIRDDHLDPFTKSNFETVFLKLKSAIIEYKENKTKGVKEASERINHNRKRIHEEREELFGTEPDIDETELGVEKKFNKKQRIYNIENSLRKAQVSANRYIYVDKVREKKARK
jgi:hypothetical protein